MAMNLSAKNEVILWWITSVAASVLLCAIFFVLFADNLVELKQSAQETRERIMQIEERENIIMAEIEKLRKTIAPNTANTETNATEAPLALSAQPSSSTVILETTTTETVPVSAPPKTQ